MTKIIATDIDGVLAINKYDKKLYRPWKLNKWYNLCEPTEHCNQYYDIILTGRRIHYKRATIRWLKENHVEYGKLIMFPNKYPKNNHTLCKYKADVIRDFEVDVFYEDDIRILNFLKSHCMSTKVELVQFND